MEEEIIQIRDDKQQYERALARFIDDKSISSRNKGIVQRFLREAALGKTIIGRAKKKIGPARLKSYVVHLTTLVNFVQKDLDVVTQQDMELFIEALEGDKILSRRPSRKGLNIVVSNSRLSERYKVDVKVSVKKFYKWLLGNSRFFPEIVEWIDTFAEEKEIPALTEAEVGRMIDRCRAVLSRALIQVLFDGGFRLSELLNVRLRHIKRERIDFPGRSFSYFVVRIPFSKTLKRTVALPMIATGKWLNLWLEEHPAKPRIRDDGTIEAEDTALQLFPLTGNAARLLVRRAGAQALGKRVYPHLLRHSSATYWSNKLPWFKLCKRFGWTMTSSMPRRYIDREGVDEVEIAKVYHEDERVKLVKENEYLAGRLADKNKDREHIVV